MKYDNQLRYAVNIISDYQGSVPLHAWLKDFFRDHKQMGSRDRKTVSNLVYAFYRLGHAVRELKIEERILLGLFLVQEQPGELLQYFRPDWNEHTPKPLNGKIEMVRASGIDFDAADIFPWKDELSDDVDHHAFCLSFLRQPDLFLRIRPGHEEMVRGKLNALVHEFLPPFSVRLPNGTKVEELFTPDKEVVIQDYSSQRIAGFIPPARTCWDACAASGGKSILVYDLLPWLELTVSDIRESILHNLRQRFRQAGIIDYQSFVMDLTRQAPDDMPYDLVLSDVPCTGSGTWSRTPEELYFFNPQKIVTYSNVQRQIIGNIVPRLKPGAQLVYSTCSVFKKENEVNAALLTAEFGMREEQRGLVSGYDLKADTMFAARFSCAQAG